jgi:hypothetical protein
MQRLGIFSICLICTLGSVAKAGIIGYSCTDDGGGINSQENFWSSSGSWGVLGIGGSQTSTSSGTMSSTFNTDTTGDPIIKYNNSVINDTGVTWTGYAVEVKLDISDTASLTSYSISGGTVTSPGDWTTSTTQLTGPTHVGNQNEYTGYLTLQSGTPIGMNGELDFSYLVSFQGTTQYTETQVQTPITTMVPEPATLALLTGGCFALWSLRRKLRT